MSKFTIILTATGLSTIIGVNLWVRQTRNECRENQQRLDAMMKDYHNSRVDAYSESKTPQQRTYLDEEAKKDKLWYDYETKMQKDWMARPFYKQIVPPPFPDYADVRRE